jgi:DNA-binding transcriptional LysR family regulator
MVFLTGGKFVDLTNLKAFYQVTVSGNFSKAANELFVSQPALSRQVAALEKELGLQLLNRQGRQVVTTDAGRRLLVFAEKIINLSDEAKKEMLEFKDLTTGELTLGASTTIANYLLPKILALYQKKHSGININLNVGNSSQIAAMTIEGRVDLGLVAGEIQIPQLYQEQFAEDELCLVISNNHNFAGNTNLPEQLCQETFLCRETGSDTQRLLDSLLTRLKITPQRKLILGDTEAIKRGVINNMGIAFLSTFTFDYEHELGLLVPLKKVSAKRPLVLIHPKGSRLSPAALAFSALLKKNVHYQ